MEITWAIKDSSGKVQIGVAAVGAAFSLSRLDRSRLCALTYAQTAPQIDATRDASPGAGATAVHIRLGEG